MEILLGVLLPFLGTTIGASFVFFMKNTFNKNLERLIFGFTSGVMIAASVWSLIIPSIEMATKLKILSWWPASLGFLLGIIFLLFADKIVQKYIPESSNKGLSFKENMMLFLSVTLHNIPEGMAVGVVFAGLISNNVSVSFLGALTLSFGIAIQNIPEGAIISMPQRSNGLTKAKAFLYGVFSGIVEPIAAIITILLVDYITPILPYLLSFSAGSMIYVVIEELVPKTKENSDSKLGIIGFSIGFLIMMILDVSLK